MIQTVFKYGLVSSALLTILFSASFLLEDYMSFSTSEIVGYTSILVALTCVHFGIKHYKKNIKNGFVSFFKGLKIGVLITLFPALTFGTINSIYTSYINPEFSELYYKEAIEKQRNLLPAADFKKKRIALQAQQKAFDNPVFKFMLMGFTVFFIGLIVTILSSIILKRSL